MAIYALGDKTPEIAESAFIHPQASIIGDVKIGVRVFVAPMVSVRGDRGPIEIGDETNLQDGVVVHSTDTYKTVIGKRVNIGHNASVHAEFVGDDAAIGMGAVLMVGSKVSEGALIANSALLHPKTKTEPFKVYAGVPAKSDYQSQLSAARELFWKRDAAAAVFAYTELVRKYPDRPGGWGELGNLYISIGSKENAAEAYYQAIGLLIQQGRPEEARKMLDVMRTLDPVKADELKQWLEQAGS